MTHPASFVQSLTEGLPFGPADLIEPGSLVFWHCRFEPVLFLDQDYDTYGISLPPSIAEAAHKRRAEYLAGRVAAARVLSALGEKDFTLLSDENRAPRWPDGLQGSLTHHASLAVCVGRRRPDRAVSGLGVDIEGLLTDELAAELWPGIISPLEYQFLNTSPLPFATALTLVFSAKESLFKALFPLVNRYFDFLDARVSRITDDRLTLELMVELAPPLPAGMSFDCVYARSESEILTVLAI